MHFGAVLLHGCLLSCFIEAIHQKKSIHNLSYAIRILLLWSYSSKLYIYVLPLRHIHEDRVRTFVDAS